MAVHKYSVPMVKRKAGMLLASELDALRLLGQTPMHGYALSTALGRPRSGVHKMLGRLDEGGYVRGSWVLEGAGAPPRRVYTITAKGRRAAERH